MVGQSCFNLFAVPGDHLHSRLDIVVPEMDTLQDRFL